MRILFVGNSHTFFNDMAHSFAMLWQAATGEEVLPTVLCHPGMGFDYHVKEYFEVRFNLLYGKYDYAVFQQKAHPFAGADSDFEDGRKLAELAKRAGVAPVFALTWAEKIAPEHQETMNAFHDRLCAETGAKLSPVGRVWQKALEADASLPLYFADGEHASVYGDYLIALTHVCFLSGHRAEGMPCIGCDFFDTEQKRIREDSKACEVELDSSICRTIQQTIDSVLF